MRISRADLLQGSCWSDGPLPCWLPRSDRGNAMLCGAMGALCDDVVLATARMGGPPGRPCLFEVVVLEPVGVVPVGDPLLDVGEAMLSLLRNTVFPVSASWIEVRCRYAPDEVGLVMEALHTCRSRWFSQEEDDFGVNIEPVSMPMGLATPGCRHG